MFHFLEKSCFWLKDYESTCSDDTYLVMEALYKGAP